MAIMNMDPYKPTSRIECNKDFDCCTNDIQRQMAFMPPNLLHCGCLVCINSEKLRSGVPKDAPWKRSVRARLGAQNWEFFEQLAG